MGIPLISGLSKLDAGPRRFLFFIVFNVISWQCIVGPALILFARSLEMQASLIGFLISFMPLSMLLVGLTVPLVNHYGPKRVMFAGWLLRNLLACAVFFIPLATTWGLRYAQYLLVGSVLAFCVLRAMGAGGWLPWLHELVPDVQRGTYFSMEAAVTQLTSVVVALIQAALLFGEVSSWRFLMVYAIGIGAGLVSLVWMALIPGGEAASVPSTHSSYVGYRMAFRDRSFMAFVFTASLGYASLALLLGSSLILFMREILMFQPSVIMAVTAAGALGIFLTIAAWGRFADYAGSGSAMFWSMLGHAACAVACMLLAPTAGYTPPMLWIVFVIASVFNAAYNVAGNRAMLGYVPRDRRVLYTNIWSIGTSMAVALPPIAAGYVIDHLHETGYYACFIATGVLGAACAFLSKRYVCEAVPESTAGNPGPMDSTQRPADASADAAPRLAS
ncbi:MAG: MFS transporter [Candidatus Hydrogenedentes bacterium]|nr:MFS transporter [Candidatus Hydrogenedentota bacterium]